MYSVAKAFIGALAVTAGAKAQQECDVWAQIGGTPMIPQSTFEPIYPLWNTSFLSSNPANPAVRIDFSYPVVWYMENGTIVHNYPFYNTGCPETMAGDEYKGLLTCTGYTYTTESLAKVLHNFSTILNPTVEQGKIYSGFLNVTSQNGCQPEPINGDGLVFNTYLDYTPPNATKGLSPS